MDEMEHAMFKLGEEAKRLAERTHSEEAKALLKEAEQVLKRAASAHHGATES